MKGKLNILIDKSIALYQARERERNPEVKAKELINRQRLGRLFYPDSSEECIRVSMLMLAKGNMKKVWIDWISIAVEQLGVDSNFLFGYESVFDEEYKRLVLNVKK